MPTPTLQYLVEAIPDDVTGNILKTAILVIFYAALRQSEVAAPSLAGFDPTKHLTRKDVEIRDDCAFINVKRAKNMQTIYEQKSVKLQPSMNHRTCVVRAILSMLTDVQTTSPHDPFLMSPDRKPITVSKLQRQWRQHMGCMGVDHILHYTA